MSIPRRRFLAGAATTSLMLAAPGLAVAALPGDRRFVFVVLRGAMDGLHTVPPLGDPNYASARGGLAMPQSAVLPLDGFYTLHPALAPIVPLWQKKQILIVHAVASPYRERSHFDGQDVLENGGTSPHVETTGWVNRTLVALGKERPPGLAVSQGVPLAIRGQVPVQSWMPSRQQGLAPETIERLRRLYAGDPEFTMAFEEGVQGDAFVATALGPDMMGGKANGKFASLAESAGKLLAAPNGPRIAVMEVLGWDTHVGQGLEKGRMADVLTQLGEGLAAMAQAMGPAWDKTIVVCASEFGRTVAMNGTNGSDHGTGSAVLIAGGAIGGGRIIADWPGLSRDKLYQGRDLMPTTDLRMVLKGILRDHVGVKDAALAQSVFPGSGSAPPMNALVRMA